MATFRTIPAPIGASPWPLPGGARRLTAVGLMAASAVLSRVAERLMRSTPPIARAAFELEFHAEAGGCHGALYVDGVWVGRIPGVTRL